MKLVYFLTQSTNVRIRICESCDGYNFVYKNAHCVKFISLC